MIFVLCTVFKDHYFALTPYIVNLINVNGNEKNLIQKEPGRYFTKYDDVSFKDMIVVNQRKSG